MERGLKSYRSAGTARRPHLPISKAHVVRERLPIIPVSVNYLAVLLNKNNSLRFIQDAFYFMSAS